MTEIKIFENEEFGEIRVAGTQEQPMFCLADVCRVLELTNSSMVKNRLNQKGVSQIDTLTSGGVQQMTYMSESNLYRLIMRSDKPQAMAFQDWICDEVIPQIRKTGSYNIKDSYQIEDPIERAKVWIEEQKRLQAIQDKADYADKVLRPERLFPTKMIALDYGMTASDFNRLLEAMKIQYKQGKHWYLYKPYINKGYAATETYPLDTPQEVAMTMKWTQNGRKFLHDFLKDKGVMTVKERNPSLF